MFPFLLLMVHGCAALPFILVGTAGVVGGVAISEDTVQSEVDADYDDAWYAALEELERMGGEINFRDRVSGMIDAKVSGSEIQVHITRITEHSIRLRVKSRKNYLPKIKLAHKISANILKRL